MKIGSSAYSVSASSYKLNSNFCLALFGFVLNGFYGAENTATMVGMGTSLGTGPTMGATSQKRPSIQNGLIDARNVQSAGPVPVYGPAVVC